MTTDDRLYAPPKTGDRVTTAHTGREGTITDDSRGVLTITWDFGKGEDELTYPQFATSFDPAGDHWRMIF